MTSQKLPTLQECLDAPAYSAVTCSPCLIESPQTQKLYITPPPQKPKKEDIRADCLGYLAKVKGIPASAKNLMTWLSNRRRWQKDGLIIISFAVTARHFNMSERQIIRLYKCLEKHNCIRVVKRGGLRGDKREANYYALGSFFDARPPKESEHIPMTKMSEVRGVIPMTKMSDDLCQECHSLPIVPPIHTHIEELPTAFNKENWLKECQRLNPSRDLKDIERTFPLALRKGAKDGDWMHLVEYFDSFYTPLSNPAERFLAPRPAVKSSCESPSLPPLDLTNPKVLEHELYYAMKNNYPTAFIIAGLDPALVKSATAKAEARLNESNANRYYRNTNRHNGGKTFKISELTFEGMTKIKYENNCNPHTST